MMRKKDGSLILSLFIHGITTTGLFLLPLLQPLQAMQFKEQTKYLGHTGTPSIGPEEIPYESSPVLTNQETVYTSSGMTLSQATITTDETSSSMFLVPWTVHLSNASSSTKGSELCLQHMSFVCQQETFPLALPRQPESLRKTQVSSPLLPTEADH